MTPMSITSTSVKKKGVRVSKLLLTRSVILQQCVPSALKTKTASQQINSYWLAKRLSVSCKNPSLKRWIVKINTWRRMEGKKGDLGQLSTENLPRHVVTNVGSNNLLPKFIGPFRVLCRRGNAYTIEMPRKMRTHTTFCVGRLRPYHQLGVSSGKEYPCTRTSPRGSCDRGAEN